ncbi:hypothetical protein GCM10012275_50450 [Longimycelium tulufanense]|uniref:Uncharacterized protein n=1 Tax=Longimycelium tulufanense TaxID=907463 RepID=A0A8J3CCF0_9PSEU|nr:hypothetical protein [Longimycelium tulufanense]GGM73629.1 hypothetical protein GCM10012275_50450 [Longimycelium tulufanense]
MHVHIYHNTNRKAMIDGYQHDHDVVLVAHYDDCTAPDHIAACNKAFALYNADHNPDVTEPDPHVTQYRERGNRSLSVGDVVACDDHFFACQNSGWSAIAEPTVAWLSMPGTTPLD